MKKIYAQEAVEQSMQVSELQNTYYWWRGDKDSAWELCFKRVYKDSEPILRFFNGSEMRGNIWGEMQIANVSKPEEPRTFFNPACKECDIGRGADCCPHVDKSDCDQLQDLTEHQKFLREKKI